MPVLGYRSNNKFIDDSIFDWCIERRNQKKYIDYFYINHIEHLICCDFVVINPLIFSFGPWNHFVYIHKKRYQHIKVLIVYEDIDEYVSRAPKLPEDCDVLWISEPENDIKEIKEMLISYIERR